MVGTPTIEDLLRLIRERGTADGFPEPDELAAELESFRALPDQETVRLALAAAVRKNERLPARLAARNRPTEDVFPRLTGKVQPRAHEASRGKTSVLDDGHPSLRVLGQEPQAVRG